MFSDYDLDFTIQWKECLHYAKIAEKHPPLKRPQEQEILKEYYDPSTTPSRKKKLKDLLVKHNLRFIIKQAKHPRFMYKGVPLIDLIDVAVIGFIKNLDEKYDPSRGNRLLTSGGWWIMHCLQKELEHRSKLVKLPQQISSELNQVRTVYREFISTGERPTPEELAVAIKDKYGEDFSVEKIKKLGRFDYDHCSLDDTPEDGSATMLDLVSDNDGEDIHDKAEAAANKSYIESLIKQLNKEQAKLITWKFGLIDLNTKRTNKEMAVVMGLDLKDYKQLEAETMTKLRSIADINKVCW